MDSDFTRFQIDLFVVAFHGSNLQVDDAIFAERADDRAILRIQRDEPVTRRDVQHAVVTFPVAPVSDAPPG